MTHLDSKTEEQDEPLMEFCADCEEETFCPQAYNGNCLAFYAKLNCADREA